MGIYKRAVDDILSRIVKAVYILIFSLMDYFNNLLYGIYKVHLHPLHCALNAAVT